MAALVSKNKSFWHYINQSDYLYIFWVTLIYYLLSVFNLNNKTIFLSLLILVYIYNLRLKNLHLSLLLTTLVSLIFLVGKAWEIQLISPLVLLAGSFPKGYTVFVIITPFQIFSGLLLVWFIRDWLIGDVCVQSKTLELFSKPAFIFLFLFFFWRVLSALAVKGIYDLDLIYSLQSLSYLIVLVNLFVYFSLKVNKQRKLSSFLGISSLFGAMSLFEAFLAVWQWFAHSSLGLAIEAIAEDLTYFEGPGQSFFSVRPVGTFNHPNQFALFSLAMVLFFLPFLYLEAKELKLKKFKMKKTFYYIFLTSAGVSLILSLGRAAWLSLFICSLFFSCMVEKRWKRNVGSEIFLKLKKIKSRHFFYLFLFIALLGIFTSPRMLSSWDLFQPTGGGETRIKLIQESLNLIRVKPFFGAGMGLSGYQMLKLKPRGVIANFPSVVHNFYLLTAAESGLPALFCFCLFCLFLFAATIKQFKKIEVDGKIKRLGMMTVLLSFLINGLMHQIFLMGVFLIIASLLIEGS